MRRTARTVRKGERGQAMVETVVALIVLLPIFLYALFLDDLLRHNLEQQEAVTSAVWDLTTMDYHKGSGFAGRAGKFTEYMYCDHTSAYGSYDVAKDCESSESQSRSDSHHQALAGHVCWLVSGGYVPRCRLVNKDFAQAYSDPTAQGLAAMVTKGGRFECSARLGVSNYLIPKDLFSQFSKVDAIKIKKKNPQGSTHIHNEMVGAGADDSFAFRESKSHILVDPWAMNQSPDVDRQSESGDLYGRTEKVYSSATTLFPAVKIANLAFLGQAVGNGLLSPLLLAGQNIGGAKPDDTDKPNVALKHAPDSVSAPPRSNVDQHKGTGRYYATPAKDWNQNHHEKTRQKRGAYYMGCSQAEKSTCP